MALIICDIPLFNKQFNKLYESISFIWVNIDYDVNVVLHMSADVSNAPDTVDNIPKIGLHLPFKLVDLVVKLTRFYFPKIPYHALQTPSCKSGGGFRAKALYCARFFIISPNCLWNIIRKMGTNIPRIDWYLKLFQFANPFNVYSIFLAFITMIENKFNRTRIIKISWISLQWGSGRSSVASINSCYVIVTNNV